MNRSRGGRIDRNSRGPLWALGLALALILPANAASQTAPSIVLPGAVSGDLNDYNLSLSGDGRRMVFARSEAAFARARILVSERGPDADEPWSAPRPVSFSDERYRDSDPWLTPDGRTLYFVSDRPAAGRADRHDLDIWRSVWRDGDWQAPEHLGDVVNRSGEELGPEEHDGTLYFATALRSGMGGLDIYAASSTAEGFASPRLLPAPINSAESESDFTLSGDGRTVLLWRTVDGRGLIHVARQQADGRWSEPEPLTDAVNIGGFNFTPAFGTGTRITFASDFGRSGQPAGLADVYEASLPPDGPPRSEEALMISQDPQMGAKALVSEAVAVVRRAALRSSAVDWASLETELLASASSAADTVDLLPVYRRLLGALGDNHSFVQVDPALREAYRARYGAEFDAVRGTGVTSSAFISRSEVSLRLITLNGGDRQAALITVPKVFGGGARSAAYANTLHDSIAGAAPAACGYIIDLRGNVGGNVWPMKLGLTALLGEDYDSKDTYARVRDGAATIIAGGDAGKQILKLGNWSALPGLDRAPVAVLIDRATGSSGEGVALAFKGRDQTRFFGRNTAGVASVTEGFTLSDGVNLVVTVEMMMDRNGAVYPHGVAPDVAVEAGEGSPYDPEDAVIEAAELWLASLPAC